MNRSKCPKKIKCKKKLLFSKQGAIGRFFDRLMLPLMRWLQGNSIEVPQGTHFWNWVSLSPELALWMLEKDKMRMVAPDPKACKRSWFPFPRFRMPRFGGWNQYVVLIPSLNEWREGEIWYIGWIDELGNCCISKVPQKKSVRMLRGPGKVAFFALNRRHKQLTLYSTYFGEIGKARMEHAVLPLH
jgi:hypothetical protein